MGGTFVPEDKRKELKEARKEDHAELKNLKKDILVLTNSIDNLERKLNELEDSILDLKSTL